MWAGLDTLLTTDALVGVDDFGVFVERKIHFPEDLLRASVHTLPASLASMRVKLYVGCLFVSLLFMRLSVILNQVFHEIHVAEIHGACVVLVHRGNLCHIIIGQREVQDVEVLRHAILVGALGDGNDSTLC